MTAEIHRPNANMSDRELLDLINRQTAPIPILAEQIKQHAALFATINHTLYDDKQGLTRRVPRLEFVQESCAERFGSRRTLVMFVLPLLVSLGCLAAMIAALVWHRP